MSSIHSTSSHHRGPLSLLIGLILGVVLGCYYSESIAAQKTEDKSMPQTIPSVDQVIENLDLEGHVEGGYFRRTYQSDHREKVQTDQGSRYLLTSIYYLLTSTSPIGHWHLNQSDIMHYYHLGDPIEYMLIHPNGTLQKIVMGPDITQGQKLQLMVPGGTWKASRLMAEKAGYGLISEAVSPGFDYSDMQLGKPEAMLKQFPQHASFIRAFSKGK